MKLLPQSPDDRLRALRLAAASRAMPADGDCRTVTYLLGEGSIIGGLVGAASKGLNPN
jgi:hypothetical protein